MTLNFSTPNFSGPKRGFPAGNPIANALVILVGALVIGASIVVGFFAFVILASLFVIFAALVGIRLWWFSRKLQKSTGEGTASRTRTERQGGVIEGEYQVVDEEAGGPDELTDDTRR